MTDTTDARRARIEATIRADVRALSRYEVLDGKGFVKLDAMENPYSLPDELADEVGDALSRVPINRYPDGSGNRVKDTLRSAFDLPAHAGLLLGNGSDELIQIITSSIATREAGVLAPEPSFVMYRRNALMAQAPFTAVSLRADFSLDLDAMLRAIDRARPALVFIAYPNNPTGNLSGATDVERIIAAAPGLVVIDEAYHAYANASFASRVLDFPNVVVLRTVSKIGMAGLRLGYAVAHPDWIAHFERLRPPYNVGSLAQAALPVLLRHIDIFTKQAARIRKERARVAAALASLGALVFPSATNFLLVRVPDANASFAALLRGKILVKNLDGTHPLLANCLRITIGTRDENDALIAVLARDSMEARR
ncbi:MAG TPA: histidinol-phosphate transaminase [Casimicrobiaceae bacterium]|nr:histidinol-phosphate transaminase [Casimicrobiaceae bacterium]